MWKVGECRLPMLLQRSGMTQQQLSEITDIKQQTISKYCLNKEKMGYANALKIAKAIRCPMEELYNIYWTKD